MSPDEEDLLDAISFFRRTKLKSIDARVMINPANAAKAFMFEELELAFLS